MTMSVPEPPFREVDTGHTPTAPSHTAVVPGGTPSDRLPDACRGVRCGAVQYAFVPAVECVFCEKRTSR